MILRLIWGCLLGKHYKHIASAAWLLKLILSKWLTALVYICLKNFTLLWKFACCQNWSNWNKRLTYWINIVLYYKSLWHLLPLCTLHSLKLCLPSQCIAHRFRKMCNQLNASPMLLKPFKIFWFKSSDNRNVNESYDLWWYICLSRKAVNNNTITSPHHEDFIHRASNFDPYNCDVRCFSI